MNITVRMVRENEDGSADCEVRVDADGMALLLQYGLKSVLREAIDNAKRECGKPYITSDSGEHE
jgi:hypothetical protein